LNLTKSDISKTTATNAAAGGSKNGVIRKQESPTNIKIRSTFIFKNSNPSFEKYFTEMKRRNTQKGLITLNNGVVQHTAEPAQAKQEQAAGGGAFAWF